MAIKHRKTISWVIRETQIKPYYDIAKYWPGALIKELPLLVGRSIGVTTLEKCLEISAKAEGMHILWYRIPLFVNAQQKCLHMCTNDMYKNVCSQIWDMPGQYCLPQISLYSAIDYHTIDYALSQSTCWHLFILLNSHEQSDFSLFASIFMISSKIDITPSFLNKYDFNTKVTKDNSEKVTCT